MTTSVFTTALSWTLVWVLWTSLSRERRASVIPHLHQGETLAGALVTGLVIFVFFSLFQRGESPVYYALAAMLAWITAECAAYGIHILRHRRWLRKHPCTKEYENAE